MGKILKKTGTVAVILTGFTPEKLLFVFFLFTIMQNHDIINKII